MTEILTSNFVVAYIDLLGQSKKLDEHQLVPSSRDENFLNWEKETYGMVMGLRQTINNMISIYNSDTLISKQLFKTNGIKIKPFSDSIIVYTSLYEEDNSYLPIIDVNSIIFSIGATLLTALSTGINFRVGIDIGVCSDDKLDGIYGSAISYAYNLECKVANYQRIIVGKELFKYISENANYSDQAYKKIISQSDLIRNNEAKELLKILLPVSNGNFMVNILSNEYKQIFDKIGQGEIAMNILSKVKNIINSYDETKDDINVITKYLLLREYFLKYINVWNKKNIV
jgi:hypothetical protein